MSRINKVTNAKLLAVLLSCLRDPRPLDIRSDSEYVCKGVSTWRSWCDTGWSHDHADLWNMLACQLRSRSTSVCVSWVKGHATRIDVQRGRTTKEDKKGNDCADALAVAGASLHQIPAEVVADACERRHDAVNVQRMMLSVLKARLRAGAEDNDAEEADRGSEMGECMEFLDDEFDGGSHIQSDVQ